MQPRGFRRPDAARYIGVSETKFATMVLAGALPCGFMVDNCRIWDIRDLDRAFDVLKSSDRAAQNASIDDPEFEKVLNAKKQETSCAAA